MASRVPTDHMVADSRDGARDRAPGCRAGVKRPSRPSPANLADCVNATTLAWPREAWRPDFSAASGEASRACLKHSLGHAVAMSRAKLTNS